MKSLSLLTLVLLTSSVGAGDRSEPQPTPSIVRPGQVPVTYVF